MWLQEGRQALLGPVRYNGRPQRGAVGTAAEANALLGTAVSEGMTLVVSHWSADTKNGMSWLDCPCDEGERSGWGCTDAWVEHPEWPWICDLHDATPVGCWLGHTWCTTMPCAFH